MKHLYADARNDKGWYAGPWNGTFAFPIGYAHMGIDEPHVHPQATEVYLVARGTAEARVEHETIHLKAGDVLIVEPGEAHTFLSSSPNYFHFVFQTPGVSDEEARADKQPVPRERLGL
jgi:mannose-6-phosphate isomerase-like protein (cupin superfamily)